MDVDGAPVRGHALPSRRWTEQCNSIIYPIREFPDCERAPLPRISPRRAGYSVKALELSHPRSCAFVSWTETRIANCDSSRMLHIVWENTGGRGGESDRVSPKQATTGTEGGCGIRKSTNIFLSCMMSAFICRVLFYEVASEDAAK